MCVHVCVRVFRQVKNLLRKYNIQLQFSDTAANLNKNGSHKSGYGHVNINSSYHCAKFECAQEKLTIKVFVKA